MIEQEKIKLILLGDAQKVVEKKEMGEEDKLCLLLCSWKDYEAFVKKNVFAELDTHKIKFFPPEPVLGEIKKFLKENSETLERK